MIRSPRLECTKEPAENRIVELNFSMKSGSNLIRVIPQFSVLDYFVRDWQLLRVRAELEQLIQFCSFDRFQGLMRIVECTLRIQY